jgi:hypothetical protein
MRFRPVVLLLLSSMCLPALAWGQESDTSLGDLARTARRAKTSQPHASVTLSDEDSASLRSLGKMGLNPCSGLTQAEAEDLLGAPLAFAPKATSSGAGVGSCAYNTASPGASLVVAVQPVNLGVHNTWQEATDGVHTDAVAGVGNEAVRITGQPGLNIRQGQAFLTITAHSGQGDSPDSIAWEHAKELAAGQKVVTRLPRGDLSTGTSTTRTVSMGDNDANQMPVYSGMANPGTPATAQDSAKADHDTCVANVNTQFDKRLQEQKSRRDYIPGEEIEKFNQQRANAIKDCDTAYANRSNH